MMCYRVVAVFAERPLKGNALAVFTDASGIDADSHGAVDRRMLSSTPLGRCRTSRGGNSDPALHHPTCGSAHADFPDDPLVVLSYGFGPNAEDAGRMAEPNPAVRR